MGGLWRFVSALPVLDMFLFISLGDQFGLIKLDNSSIMLSVIISDIMQNVDLVIALFFI